jgi:diketogulonate reductase-like aldo/keto reductase
VKRRRLLGMAALLALRAEAAMALEKLRTRQIPTSGEELPAIGMGTWRTFDGDASPALRSVLQRFFEAGGRLIDSSPMYGRSEETVGKLLTATPRPFLATKVWTSGRDEGIAQMRRSMKLMWPAGSGAFDLMQIHNLLDWKTHVKTLRAWKEQGLIRYWGITHYLPSAFDEMERIIKSDKPDFVQLPYSVGLRDAEERLLPLCSEMKAAVLVDRPFEGGTLFRDSLRRPLPSWAAQLDCTSWAQIFLKFILAHPAVTCPIPATSSPEHMADNLRAGLGRLPNLELRRRIVAEVTGGTK